MTWGSNPESDPPNYIWIIFVAACLAIAAGLTAVAFRAAVLTLTFYDLLAIAVLLAVQELFRRARP